MTPIPLSSGDELDVVIDEVLPFGALVRTASGAPGLVRRDVDDVGDVGTTVRVEVVDVDQAEARFSARPA